MQRGPVRAGDEALNWAREEGSKGLEQARTGKKMRGGSRHSCQHVACVLPSPAVCPALT